MSRPRKKHRKARRRWRPSMEEELLGFLSQRSISARNIERIKALLAEGERTAEQVELAEVILEVARLRPGSRRRLPKLAREHPAVFDRLVRVLPEEWWHYALIRWGGFGGRLWDLYDQALFRQRFLEVGCVPCWCGSSLAYWHCCAQRDEETARQWAVDDEERGYRENPETIPWWHPHSGIDPYTRSSYELWYADADHPLAMPPPEGRS